MLMPLAIGMPGLDQWVIIAVIGLIFFGRRLPEVGRSLGQGIVEFKKGLKGIEQDIDTGIHSPGPSQQVAIQQPRLSTPEQPTQPYKFDPYTGKPIRFDPYTGKPLSEEPVASTTNEQWPPNQA